ncbi:MAG: twin-arginine translocation signal domain-containing protein, partial [Nostoc sp.]
MGNDTKSDESGKRLRGVLDRREFLTATAIVGAALAVAPLAWTAPSAQPRT